MGSRVNTIMQTCFFAISGILPREQAIAEIKHSIEKTYGRRGEAVVKQNFEAVDQALAHLHEIPVPAKATSKISCAPGFRPMPRFRQEGARPMIASKARKFPFLPCPWMALPTGTTQWEKRNIALDIPVWEADLCIQCGKCVFVCPHAVIRHKVYDKAASLEPQKPSSTWIPNLRNSPAWLTLCKSLLKTAPAVRCASKPVLRKTRPRLAAKPSIWLPNCHPRSEAKNWDFFYKLPELIAPR